MKNIKISTLTQLHTANCVQFGQFKLKTGVECPYYIDLRELSMHPSLFDAISDLVAGIILKDNENQAIVGVPYGAVPLASVVAHKLRYPYFPVRKEVKGYGRVMTAGNYKQDIKFTLIEDVITSGTSIQETIEKLPENSIKQIVILVDREQGGKQVLQEKYPNIKIDCLFSVSEILNALLDNNIITQSIFDHSLSWMKEHHINSS